MEEKKTRVCVKVHCHSTSVYARTRVHILRAPEKQKREMRGERERNNSDSANVFIILAPTIHFAKTV